MTVLNVNGQTKTEVGDVMTFSVPGTRRDEGGLLGHGSCILQGLWTLAQVPVVYTLKPLMDSRDSGSKDQTFYLILLSTVSTTVTSTGLKKV